MILPKETKDIPLIVSNNSSVYLISVRCKNLSIIEIQPVIPALFLLIHHIIKIEIYILLDPLQFNKEIAGIRVTPYQPFLC